MEPTGGTSLLEDRVLPLLRCPSCHASATLERHAQEHKPWRCNECRHAFAERAGIPIFVNEPTPNGDDDESEDVPRWRKGTDESAQAAYFEGEVAHHRPASHPVVEGFARQRWSYLETLMDLASVESALDVGCGSGFSTLYAPEHLKTVGCDQSLTMLSQTRRRNSLCASALELPFGSESFDLVYCWELLHHVEEPHRALAEMARVSRRYVVFLEPNPLNLAQFLFSLYDPEHRWVLRYGTNYVRRQVETVGLRVVRHVRGGLIFPNKTPGWLFPLLSRLPYRIPFIGISHVVIAEKASL